MDRKTFVVVLRVCNRVFYERVLLAFAQNYARVEWRLKALRYWKTCKSTWLHHQAWLADWFDPWRGTLGPKIGALCFIKVGTRRVDHVGELDVCLAIGIYCWQITSLSAIEQNWNGWQIASLSAIEQNGNGLGLMKVHFSCSRVGFATQLLLSQSSLASLRLI